MSFSNFLSGRISDKVFNPRGFSRRVKKNFMRKHGYGVGDIFTHHAYNHKNGKKGPSFLP